MPVTLVRRRRTALYLSLAGLMLMVAAVTALSARDPDGLWLRLGEVMLTAGIALWLPGRALLPAAIAVWAVTNVLRSSVDGSELVRADSLAELPGLIGLTVFAYLTRRTLKELEEDDFLVGMTNEDHAGIDAETGVYDERLLRPALEAELARSQRFGRECALVLTGLDKRYEGSGRRDDDVWTQSLVATAGLLRGTRNHIDRVFRYGESGFAMLLPESGGREVAGMVRRLRRVARAAEPPEGEPAGPLPLCYGATFFPACATSTDEMLRRAEITLSLASQSETRLELDAAIAEAPSTTLVVPDAEPVMVDDTSLADGAALAETPFNHQAIEVAAPVSGEVPVEIEAANVEVDVQFDDPAEDGEPTEAEAPAPMRLPEPAIQRNSADSIEGRMSRMRAGLDRREPAPSSVKTADGQSLGAFDLEADTLFITPDADDAPLHEPARRSEYARPVRELASVEASVQPTPEHAHLDTRVEPVGEPIDPSSVAAEATVEELIEALELPVALEALGEADDTPDEVEPYAQLDASTEIEREAPDAMLVADEQLEVLAPPENESDDGESAHAANVEVPAHHDFEEPELAQTNTPEIEAAEADEPTTDEVEMPDESPVADEPAAAPSIDPQPPDDMSELRRRLSETMGVIRTLKSD